MKLKITMIEGTPQADDGTIRVVDTGRVTIGRGDDCSWSLPDPDRALSKHHCEVLFQGTVFVLKDTSTNGVFMNDGAEPLGRGKSAVLKNGDTFRAADFVFRADLIGDEIDPFATPEPIAAPAGVARPARGDRSFVDPGSPLDSNAFSSNAADPFDAFAGSLDDGGDDGFLTNAKTDGWAAGADDTTSEFASGWGDDWSTDSTGDEFASGSDGGFFDKSGPDGGGFDAFSASDPIGSETGSVPFGPGPELAGDSGGDAPWGGGAVDQDMGAAGRSSALAAILIDALLMTGRHHEAIAGRLGVRLGAEGGDLPAVSGESLVAHLLQLPGDEGTAMARGLGRAVVAQAEAIAQTLEAGGTSGAADGGDPFGDDPFK
ncbi:FHA domain-containing protein [Fodinicurvata sp. EGI_FJ10296]|uniref:FHA domain-containing protein n=1 Tax=Fodinicurvata sp. EGI_FJ10296 TaxID=3231908 RepID=UPI0034568F64